MADLEDEIVDGPGRPAGRCRSGRGDHAPHQPGGAVRPHDAGGRGQAVHARGGVRHQLTPAPAATSALPGPLPAERGRCRVRGGASARSSVPATESADVAAVYLTRPPRLLRGTLDIGGCRTWRCGSRDERDVDDRAGPHPAGGRLRPGHPRVRVPQRVRQRGPHAAERRADHDGRPVRRHGVRGARLLPRRPAGPPVALRPLGARPGPARQPLARPATSRSACATRSSPAPPPSSSPGPCTPTTRPGCSRASRGGPRRRSCPASCASIDRGRPVVLGLVVARSLGAIGDNHQVVAYGYERSGRRAGRRAPSTTTTPPASPVTLTSWQDQHDWTASNGHVWRGFFVQDYTPRSPAGAHPHAPDANAPGVHRRHRQALARVDRPDPALARAAVHPPRHGRAAAGHVLRGFRRQRPLAARRHRRPGVPPAHGSVRPAAPRARPGRWLHSRSGVPSPISHQQEVSAAGRRVAGHLARRARAPRPVARRLPRPARARRRPARSCTRTTAPTPAHRRPAGGHRSHAERDPTTGGRSWSSPDAWPAEQSAGRVGPKAR